MTAAVVEAVGHDQGVVLLRVSGEVDLANVAEVDQQLRGAVPNDALGIAIDVTTLRYIDSSGIQLLFRFVRDLAACRQGLGLVVRETSPVHKLLKITNIGEVAVISDAIADCVRSLRSARGGLA